MSLYSECYDWCNDSTSSIHNVADVLLSYDLHQSHAVFLYPHPLHMLSVRCRLPRPQCLSIFQSQIAPSASNASCCSVHPTTSIPQQCPHSHIKPLRSLCPCHLITRSRRYLPIPRPPIQTFPQSNELQAKCKSPSSKIGWETRDNSCIHVPDLHPIPRLL